VDAGLEHIRNVDVFSDDCPAHHLVERIGSKWTVLVLYALSQGTKRYTELQRQIGKISPKMLTQVLRNLEKDGMLERRVHPVVPPVVEYTLTPMGLSLTTVLAQLCLWADANRKELMAALRID